MTVSGPYTDPNFLVRQYIGFPITGTKTTTALTFPNNVRVRAGQVTVVTAGSASSTGKVYIGTASAGQWLGTASTAGYTLNIPDMNVAVAAGTAVAVALTGDNTQAFNVILEVHTDPLATSTWSGP